MSEKSFAEMVSGLSLSEEARERVRAVLAGERPVDGLSRDEVKAVLDHLGDALAVPTERMRASMQVSLVGWERPAV